MKTRLWFGCVLLLLAAGAAFAQPFDGFLVVNSGSGYVLLPNHPALSFAGKSFTFEAWVSLKDVHGCSTVAGNKWTAAQWIGICGGALRSYVSGSGSGFDAGFVPDNNWTHIAVTFDNATLTRSHYVDGELVGQRVESQPLTASGEPWRILSDVSWEFTPTGGIDEVRFWNVARTKEQIRASINKQDRTSLVAYPLAGNANDPVGGLNGTVQGTAAFLTDPVGTGCSTNSAQLCVGPGGRYSISATFDSGTTVAGTARVVTALTTPESGLFYFFGPNNWEIMVKLLDGCGINSKKWVFASATTDQHFELVVTDIQRGATRRYFGYAGSPAPAIIDVEALATCP